MGRIRMPNAMLRYYGVISGGFWILVHILIIVFTWRSMCQEDWRSVELRRIERTSFCREDLTFSDDAEYEPMTVEAKSEEYLEIEAKRAKYNKGWITRCCMLFRCWGRGKDRQVSPQTTTR